MPVPPVAASSEPDHVWHSIRAAAAREARDEPVLASFLHATILNHDRLEAALSFHLAQKLGNPAAPALLVREVIEQAFASDPSIGHAIRCDLRAVQQRDSACPDHAVAFLFFKGFHALESYRVAHWLWCAGRRALAGAGSGRTYGRGAAGCARLLRNRGGGPTRARRPLRARS